MNNFRVGVLSGSGDRAKLEEHMMEIHALHSQTIGAPPYNCPITFETMRDKAMRSLLFGAVVLLYCNEKIVGYMGGEIGMPYHELVDIAVRDFGLPRHATAVLSGIYICPKYQGIKLSKLLTYTLYSRFYVAGYTHVVGYTKPTGKQIHIHKRAGYNINNNLYRLKGVSQEKLLMTDSFDTLLEKTKEFSSVEAWNQQIQTLKTQKSSGRTSRAVKPSSIKNREPITSSASVEMIFT